MIHAHPLWDQLAASGLLAETRLTETIKFIDHLANDSRKVGSNGLFVAIRGVQSDGHLFIDKAVNNGAIAIVCEAVPADAATRYPGTAFARVSDSRAALAELAHAFYGNPSSDLTLMGITGTNGKTTTAFLCHHLFQGLGMSAGLLSTVEYRIGEKVVSASHTTPDVLDLARMMQEMVQQGCSACAMEVSSHALDQERVRGLHFDVAVFSNLTRDHLDYHDGLDSYLAAKGMPGQDLLVQAMSGVMMNTGRRDDPPTENAAGDQAAHGEKPGLYLPDTNHYRAHVGRGGKAAGCDGGEVADGPLLNSQAIDTGCQILPLTGKSPAGVAGADGFGTSDGIHQHALSFVGARELLLQQAL